LEIISKIKQKGNDLFRKQNYSEAAMKYFEAVIELEDLSEKSHSISKI